MFQVEVLSHCQQKRWLDLALVGLKKVCYDRLMIKLEMFTSSH